MPQKPKRHFVFRGFLKATKFFLAVFALPAVRNFVWKRATGKAREKIVDVEAKIVNEEKNRKKLF